MCDMEEPFNSSIPDLQADISYWTLLENREIEI